MTRLTLPTCRAHYPDGPDGCACRLLPRLHGLPRISVGSASATSLSRPAQASLTLRPVGLLSRPRRPLSRGFGPAGCPSEPLVSYQLNRQLAGWNLPPLVDRALRAHSYVRVSQHTVCPVFTGGIACCRRSGNVLEAEPTVRCASSRTVDSDSFVAETYDLGIPTTTGSVGWVDARRSVRRHQPSGQAGQEVGGPPGVGAGVGVGRVEISRECRRARENEKGGNDNVFHRRYSCACFITMEYIAQDRSAWKVIPEFWS